MSDVLTEAVKLTNKPIRIVYVTQSSNESVPFGGIKFDELINIKGNQINKIYVSNFLKNTCFWISRCRFVFSARV